MKTSLCYSVSIALALLFLISCGPNGDEILEIKLFPVKSGKDFQYVDRTGKIVINPQFQSATVFRDGLALVQTSGDNPKWGFINEEGKYVINAQYKEATVFSQGIAWVVADNAAPSAINTEGEVKFSLPDAEQVRRFQGGMAAFLVVNEEGEEKWGFVDTDGRIAINPQFAGVSNFSDGVCAVVNSEGKWGFIDKEGKVSISYQFDGAGDFKNGVAIVQSAEKYGVIDQEGKYTVNPQFSSIQEDGDWLLVSQDEKFGWSDKEGKLVINPQFSAAYPFQKAEVAAVQSGDAFGYIDREGKILINPQFDFALPFNGDLAVVYSGDKVGFINSDGKYVINPQFDQVSDDLFTYLFSGGSRYSSVTSDFFNVAAVTGVLNLESPEGFTDNATFDDIIKKIVGSKEKFSRYGTEHEVLTQKKIVNGAYYSFYVYGNPYDNVTVQKESYYGGYYNEYERRFNGEKKPTGFAYDIILRGKGAGKQEEVIKSIQSKLKGYVKDDSKSDSNIQTYTKGEKQVTIVYNTDGVTVHITSDGTVKFRPGSSDEWAAADSTAAAVEYDYYDEPLNSSEYDLDDEPDGTFMVLTDKAYFHSSPNLANRRKAYLIRGEIGTFTDFENNFGYLRFTNARGVVTEGWISLSDVQLY
jgi:hypothetical protein